MTKLRLLLCCIAILSAAARGMSDSPGAARLYSSTRSVTALTVDGDGTLWAATRGGILHRQSDGNWTKFDQANGLPDAEVLNIEPDGNTVRAVFPTSTAVLKDGIWSASPSAIPDKPFSRAIWRGMECVATPTTLRIKDGNAWRDVELPMSTGTHISALLPRGDKLWAAMFGDGIWEYDGKAWSMVKNGLPARAREITAMARPATGLVVGTRREGVWEYNGKTWRQFIQPDEPYNANCENSFVFGNQVFFSTLEDGLVVHTTKGWKRYCSPEISSDAPRQMVSFAGKLYLRHGNGKVDSFDGRTWTRNVFAGLPRRQVSGIAADDKRIYAAQWGGWSEFDGKTWQHHLRIAELQGCAISALLPAGNTLWIGIQGRGLAEIDRPSGQVRWHDERQGLPDDWVKRLSFSGKSIYAGTFVGGLAKWDGDNWSGVSELGQGEITDLCAWRDVSLLVATRKGVWLIAPGATPTRLPSGGMPTNVDAQTLCTDASGVWIGTRTGIYQVSYAP